MGLVYLAVHPTIAKVVTLSSKRSFNKFYGLYLSIIISFFISCCHDTAFVSSSAHELKQALAVSEFFLFLCPGAKIASRCVKSDIWKEVR